MLLSGIQIREGKTSYVFLPSPTKGRGKKKFETIIVYFSLDGRR